MAARFLASGYEVYGEERTREHAQHLVDQGLSWRDTPREVAEAADIVLTSIPGDSVLEAVGAGPDGILEGLAPGKIWVDLSTMSPRASRDMAERVRGRGAAMLDAPVSGSVPQVRSGTLTIMVGGDEEAFVRVEPVLRVLGTPTRIGENGQGLALKLDHQHQPGRADARVLRGPAPRRARRRRPEAGQRRDDRKRDRLTDAEAAGSSGPRPA